MWNWPSWLFWGRMRGFSCDPYYLKLSQPCELTCASSYNPTHITCVPSERNQRASCSAILALKNIINEKGEKILFAKGLLGELPLGLLTVSLKWKWPAV